jgi:hypothetical protein
MMAGKSGKPGAAKDAIVHTTVHIGETKDIGGLGLAVDIKVEGVSEELLKLGHEVAFFLSSNNIPRVENYFLRTAHTVAL